MARVVISLVTWNSANDLPACLEAIARQTYRDFQLDVVDNASNDGTIEMLDRLRVTGYELRVTHNNVNRGFAAAHNQSIRWARRHGAEFVLVLNPDVALAPNAVEEMIAAMGRHPEAGSVGIPLLHDDQTIDSLGLAIGWGGRWYERGAGAPYMKRDGEEKVLGISGACVMMRLATNESFDERFFAYKEDIDLALRLHEKGWESWLTYKTCAVHERALRHDKLRVERSAMRNYLSYRNHLYLLKKHWHHLPVSRIGVVLYELGKTAYVLVREPHLLKAWKECLNFSIS